MLLVQQTEVPIKLLASRLHRMNMISQADVGGPEDVQAVKNLSAAHSRMITRDSTLMSPSILVSTFALSFTFRYDIPNASARISFDCMRDFSMKLKCID